jgi:hypothetical protein
MASFSRLIRFESDAKIFFSDLGADTLEPPFKGSQIKAYTSIDDLAAGRNEATVTLDRVLSPPIYSALQRSFS